VLLQGLAYGPGGIGQHAQPCCDNFEVVVTQQLQCERSKLWQLLLQDVGLSRAQVLQAALYLLNGIGSGLHVWKEGRRHIDNSDMLYSKVCVIHRMCVMLCCSVLLACTRACGTNNRQYSLCSV
jgi:hypothetical protein